MENAFKRDLQNYPLYFLLWTVLGLFYFSQGLTQRLVLHDPTPWWHYLVAWLSGIYIWAILTPVILFFGRQFPIDRRPRLRPITLHLLLGAGFSTFELSLESILYSKLNLFPMMKGFRETLAQMLVKGFHGGVLQYWMVLGVQWGVLYYHRYQERSGEVLKIELRASELQSQLARAQLNALKMQLQPHFLFNTLNAITVLVRQQKSKDAEQMLGHLSDLLRGVLEDVDAQEVSLRRELEYLQLYLAIEQVRFPDRLRVEISADSVTQEAFVPQLILQPIVENAIRHGIGRSSSAGLIQIRASKINARVELQIEDDGPGLSPSDSSKDQGVGLANTRARLRQLYGDDARLEIEDGDRGGVIVTMSIPFRDCHPER
ncbi:MAG: two-component system, LytTR family, sensor kinase [Acidobacteriaceae bacterium]|jgi:signal transduction histidine kinase|nr:two-component system, LytTR family, sensor kinase [Acidobacteriaceae bacterium]